MGIDASQRSKVLTLRSENIYNDGQLHSVFLSRQGIMWVFLLYFFLNIEEVCEKLSDWIITRITLRVDDREVASGTLMDQTTIGAPSMQIFIGGFPDKIRPSSSEMPMAESFIGCISHIFSNYE